MGARASSAVIAIAASATACSRESQPAPQPAPPAEPGRGHDPTPGDRSTIAARDYLGPDACGECHPAEHARWAGSLHAIMNQRAGDRDAVIGAFDGATLAYAGGTATFTHDDGGYVMTLDPRRCVERGRGASGASPPGTCDHRRVRYRVTRTIGHRGLQEYVGIADGRTTEVRLPLAWWPRRGGWYPQPYFDPWLAEADFDPYAEVREPWAERCPWCHSTYPFAQRIARASRLGVGHGLEQAFTTDAAGGDRLDLAQQVTVGISCESCHLGGRAHAAGAPIHFVPLGATPRPGAPRPTTFAAERADPQIVNRVCAQCHSGPSPRFPDGGGSRNSSEALDLAASRCAARCVDCHDPHVATGRGVDAPAIAACTRCHDRYATAAAARAHAGHDASAATCLDCHMPKIVMGIDRHVRTHRISSPTQPAMLAAAAPNACNLCHLDRTIAWTAAELRAGYEVRVDPRIAARYGGLSVGEVWLASREPALRLIAASAYARSPMARSALVDVARLLDDPLPHVRAWASFAIEDILGRPLRDADYDPRRPAAARRRQIDALLRAAR